MSADGVVHGKSTVDATRTYVTIKGPNFSRVYTAKGADVHAPVLEFAAKLNAASRQLQGAASAFGASATGSAPPGWYPDPSGAAGQQYWDGQRWHNATQR
jgi:hypothetical protein